MGFEVALGVDDVEPVLPEVEVEPRLLPPLAGGVEQLGGVPVCPAGQLPGVKLTVVPASAGLV